MEIDHLVHLRHELHRNPELSGQETNTSSAIASFMKRYRPDRTVRLGDTGLAFVFEGAQPGSCVVYRAELDALPIDESGSPVYCSREPGISHACGHDGHMAILAGLGEKIAAERPVAGKAVLLFQPAEETGQGAHAVMQDPAFRELQPGRIFALHNLPGFPMGEVLVREGVFAAASTGMIIDLKGKSSHAGEPENGTNPDRAMARIVEGVHAMNKDAQEFSSLAFATVIHLRLGEVAFGTSPGYGEVMLTLRAYEDSDLQRLKSLSESMSAGIAKEEHLEHTISYTEVFPATRNSGECTEMIRQAALQVGLNVRKMEVPFRWTEDFGYYTGDIQGGFFGLGSGEQQPALHHPDYDFPDTLIGTGVSVFFHIYRMNHINTKTL